MNAYSKYRFAVVLLVALVYGCSGGSPANEKARRLLGVKSEGAIDLGNVKYTPSGVSSAGSLSGTIRLDGDATMDAMPVTSDQRTCGTAAPGAVDVGPKGGLANTVVWVSDVSSGKRLPVDRRVIISSANCLVQPRLQATVVGSAVNVFNDDKLPHRLVFVRVGTTDTLGVMPFFNVGQVVPTDKLTKTSGIVEVRCTVHPWTRGYLVVLNHPYFTITKNDGRFSIDSLPPGEHRVMAWHENMSQPVERTVRVSSGGDAKLDFGVSLEKSSGKQQAAGTP